MNILKLLMKLIKMALNLKAEKSESDDREKEREEEPPKSMLEEQAELEEAVKTDDSDEDGEDGVYDLNGDPSEIPSQNDPVFPSAIRKYGCKFMKTAAIAMVYCDKALTAKAIKRLFFELGESDRYDVVDLSNAEMGKHESRLINRVFEELGHPELRGSQVGYVDGEGVPRAWNGNKRKKFFCRAVRWKTEVAEHFTLEDKEGEKELYDPYDKDLASYDLKRVRRLDTYLYHVWEKK